MKPLLLIFGLWLAAGTAVRAAEELLELGVTAIVASSDNMALGAMRALHRHGLRVPADISIIGYNDSYMLDFTDPPLTAVRQPVERIAENTTRAIVALTASRELPLAEVLIEPEFRLRGSTGPGPHPRDA